MLALSDLLTAKKYSADDRRIPLAQQLAQGRPQQPANFTLARILRWPVARRSSTCSRSSSRAADADKNWYEHLYILGDDHFSAAGNHLMFREMAKRLLPEKLSSRHVANHP